MKDKKFYVYVHYYGSGRKVGKPFYVGKGQGRRYKETDKRNNFWKNIVKKYDYTHLIVKRFDNEEDAFSYEIKLISEYRKEGIVLANLTDGGEGASGAIRTKAQRRKMGRKQRNSWVGNTKRKDAMRRRMLGTYKGPKSPLWKHYYFCGDYGRFDSYTDMQHTIGKSDNRRKFNSTNPKWDHWFTSKDKNDPRQIPQVECADELVLVEDTPETLLLEKEQKNRYYQWAKQLKDPIKRELMLRGFDDIPAFAKEVGLSNKKVWNMFKHLKKVAEKELNT